MVKGSRKGIKNIVRHPTMPQPNFAVVLSEGVSKIGGIVDKLEVIDLLAEQKCACGGNCSCKTEVKKTNCTCVGYAGQNYNCPEHIAKVECPNCKCIDVEKELHVETSMVDFSCTLCGVFYARRTADGEYQFH